MTIPKKIIQIAIGADYISNLPLERIETLLQSKNPEYEYIFLKDRECLTFLTVNYPEYLSLFHRLERPQYKSDLIRYLYIHKYGGFYVDIDLLPSVSFEELNNKTNSASSIFTIGAHHDGKLEMANGFFGSVEKNPVFLDLVKEMEQEPNPSDYGMNVKRMYRILSSKYNVIPYHSEQGTYFLREMGPTNNAYDIFVKENDHVCFSNGHTHPFPTLYLTYNNKDHTDGAGSQIQRILTIYMCAKYFQLGYIHTPIFKLDYQGLRCLEENTSEASQVELYNDLIKLPSDNKTEFRKIYTTKRITYDTIHHILKEPGPILLIGTYCSVIDEGYTSLFKPFDLYWIEPIIRTPIIIAVHIRRGELMVVDSDRMLPNSYYIGIIQALSKVLKDSEISFEFHIHTECLTKEITVTPTHHGILERIKTDIVLTPSNSLEDFKNIPYVSFRINEHPIKTIKELTNSDILIASRSSFSYVAAILKQKGCVLFHPFWHTLSNSWIPTRTPEDVFKHREKIVFSVTR